MSRKTTVDDYSKVVVAKYLKKNGFTETLNAFLRESGQTSKILADGGEATQIGANHSAFEELETLLSERIEYAEHILSNGIKEMTVNDSLPALDTGRYYVPTWNHHAAFNEVPFEYKESLTSGLPLNVSFCEPDDSLIISTSSKEVVVYTENEPPKSFSSLSQKFGIIRLCGSVGSTATYYLCCLDGTLILQNGDSNSAFKLHKRIISHIKFIPEENNLWFVISCGLDNYLKLHLLDLTNVTLQEVSSVKLTSPCTSLQVARDGISGDPTIFLTRQDFTHVMCYKIVQQRLILSYKIALNNSQFSAFSFNVRDMVILGDIAPDGLHKLSARSTLAVVTSHIPFMRLLLVEIPTLDTAETSEANAKTFYDKVLRNMATEVSQDPYSQPILAALQHGNGVLVGGNQGLYALDIEQGDSWLLDLAQILKGQRIKCMQVNLSGTKLVLSLSNSSVHLFNLDIEI